MPRKKSVKRVAREFQQHAEDVFSFLDGTWATLSDEHQTWIHEYALLRLYREFEHLMLHAIIGAINNNTVALSERTGVQFPKHLTDEVCEYIVIRDGYFDFKGRDGLINQLKRLLPSNHYLIAAVKKSKFKNPIERLVALRNFAAHESSISRRRVKEVLGLARIGAAGEWFKRHGRVRELVDQMKELASEIERAAPY
jgi:hypothetical protein